MNDDLVTTINRALRDMNSDERMRVYDQLHAEYDLRRRLANSCGFDVERLDQTLRRDFSKDPPGDIDLSYILRPVRRRYAAAREQVVAARDAIARLRDDLREGREI